MSRTECCCAGIFGAQSKPVRQVARPDGSPRTNRPNLPEKVATLEEALALERPEEGAWVPSPQSSRGSPREWATPVPRNKGHEPEFTTGGVDFDLIIDEQEHTSIAAQMDSDGRRMDAAVVPASRRSRYEVEQLVGAPGSLPQPMTSEKREAAIRSLIPTATVQMLSKVPAHLLESSSQESQNLRRKLCRGATVVFMAVGLPGKRFVLEKMAQMGVKSVVIDHPDSWSRALVEEGVIAKFLPVDMSMPSEEVFKHSLNYLQHLGEDGVTGAADGITTFVELSVPMVARLCESMGLPGFRPSSVDSARDKHQTRAALKRAGLPYPRNMKISDAAELAEAGRIVGFPAVLKPVSGAASLGVKKVESMEDLERCYRDVVKELSQLVVSSGALIKGDSDHQGVDASQVIDLTVLLEQYLDGVEVDVDVVMSGGQWWYAAVTDNGPTLEPYFNETWACSPSLLPKQQQSELKDLAINSIRALGFDSGVFHVECKYTSTGPQLVEVNARMGGGQVRDTNLLTWGVDLVEETVFIALGVPVRPPVPRQPLSGVAYCYVNAGKSGTLGSLDFLKETKEMEGVYWAKPLTKPGAKVVGPEEGLPTWIVDLLVMRPTAKEALDFLMKLEGEMPIEIQ